MLRVGNLNAKPKRDWRWWYCAVASLLIVVLVSTVYTISSLWSLLHNPKFHEYKTRHDIVQQKEEDQNSKNNKMTSGSQTILSQKVVYGTAWKAGNTAALVFDALTAGFRAIDTAGQ